MNIVNVLKCQTKHFYRNLWITINRNSRLKLFMFKKLPILYTKLRYTNLLDRNLLNFNRLNDLQDKMFWLSVYYRHPLILKCADKYKVREYVDDCGLSCTLNELYAVYDDDKEIDFNVLPNRFVLKSNRGSGDNYFCEDKNDLTEGEFFDSIKGWKNNIYGVDTAEYQYYNIPFKILCEKFLVDRGGELVEYQLFCFNGEPDSFLVRNDLETTGKNPFAVTYSLDWQRLYYRVGEEKYNEDLKEPHNREKMIEYARILSKPFPHVRVDFYEIGDKLVFGEMTFSTHGNILSNYKPEILKMWGDKLILPPRYKGRDAY